MYIENANRAFKTGYITPHNLEPNPKNPMIASFFRNIGYADQLGSGVRNLFKYSQYYSGKNPQFIEGDIFKIIVPLDDSYSFDFDSVNDNKRSKVATKDTIDDVKVATKDATLADKETFNLNDDEKKLLLAIEKQPKITQSELEKATEIALWVIKRTLPRLQQKGILVRIGGKRYGKWEVKYK